MKDSMRQAFAAYARDHEAASIRRCWSTWNVLCTFFYTGEQLAVDPMQLVDRPKLAKPLPKALPRTAVGSALGSRRRTTRTTNAEPIGLKGIWRLILTGLLAGLRAEELLLDQTSTRSAPPMTGGPSSTSKAKAAKNAACPSRSNYSP